MQQPSVIDILKYLPKTNCRDCGLPACMAFAAMILQGQAELSQCPYIGPEAADLFGGTAEQPAETVEDLRDELMGQLKREISKNKKDLFESQKHILALKHTYSRKLQEEEKPEKKPVKSEKLQAKNTAQNFENHPGQSNHPKRSNRQQRKRRKRNRQRWLILRTWLLRKKVLELMSDSSLSKCNRKWMRLSVISI